MTGVAQNRRGFGQKAAARACSGVKALPRSSGQGDPKPGIETENNSELFSLPPSLLTPARHSLHPSGSRSRLCGRPVSKSRCGVGAQDDEGEKK